MIAPAADDVDRHARFPREGIDALQALKLLSGYLPTELGGLGLDVVHMAQICELLGHYCGSTAMVFAMHQIQVACIVHHARGSVYFDGFLRQAGGSSAPDRVGDDRARRRRRPAVEHLCRRRHR